MPTNLEIQNVHGLHRAKTHVNARMASMADVDHPFSIRATNISPISNENEQLIRKTTLMSQSCVSDNNQNRDLPGEKAGETFAVTANES